MRHAVLVLVMALVAAPPAISNPYCIPFKGRDRVIKVGSTCPTGYFAAANCSEALHGNTGKAVPKLKGAACLSGSFASSGDYCVRQVT